jgi:copper(I)-binding protein
MKKSLTLASFAFALCAAPAFAAGVAERVEIVDPYVRMAPPGAKTTGAFMLLKNAGDQEAKLVKAASAAAAIVELHDHINDGGVMRMRQVKEIVVPAKGETALKPGSYHVMLIDTKAPLKEGDHVVINLGFADGSSKEVHATVRKPTAAAMPMKDMDHGKMHKH